MTHQNLTFRVAAEHVLREAATPLTATAITERALKAGLIATGGKTPSATMESRLATSIKQAGEASPFVRVAPRTYALRIWVAQGTITPPALGAAEDVRIVFYPEYETVRGFLKVIAGMTRAQITGLRAAMWEHRGTLADNADWTSPDEWIPQRLKGEFRDIALRIWTDTNGNVNPRHMGGHWLLSSGYDLVADNAAGSLSITQRGQDFIDYPNGAAVRELDEREGLLAALAILAEQGPSAPGAVLAPWLSYLRGVSRIRAATTARSFLYYRFRNLLARGLVTREGQRYEITPVGLAWLKESSFAEVATTVPDATRQLWDLITAQRNKVRTALHEYLREMDPYEFEHLVSRLLDSMGYTDVEVTVRSGDKGVDVVGRIALGITEVREVVQAKRQKNNVHRPVLDMLRGALHRFGAVKGTIITLGGFAKGARDAAFEPGVAPITLIDGQKFVDLLIDNGIGVQTKTVELLEIDVASLASEAADEESLT